MCKRNSSPKQVETIVKSIQLMRPDLRLHGFGIKATALRQPVVLEGFYSVDSMAWSFAARYKGRNPNDWREAVSFSESIERQPQQGSLGINVKFRLPER